MDLLQEAAVTPAEVEALARKLNMRLYRTCVKDNLNVSEVFEFLAAQFILKGGAGEGGREGRVWLQSVARRSASNTERSGAREGRRERVKA